MSGKVLHSVYKAASQITVHRYATAVGHAGRSSAPKPAPPAPTSQPSKKSARPAKKGD